MNFTKINFTKEEQSVLEIYNQKIAFLNQIYLTNKEEQYYNMFSKMENAMNQANSQMPYLQSMLELS